MEGILKTLRSCLRDAVWRNPADVLFFSGGLDTSILATLSPTTPLLHICLEDSGEDLPYAEAAARAMLTDEDWAVPVRLISCDQPYYYRMYRQVVGEIPLPGPGEVPCPHCSAGLPPDAHHCRTCGWCEER